MRRIQGRRNGRLHDAIYAVEVKLRDTLRAGEDYMLVRWKGEEEQRHSWVGLGCIFCTHIGKQIIFALQATLSAWAALMHTFIDSEALVVYPTSPILRLFFAPQQTSHTDSDFELIRRSLRWRGFTPQAEWERR